MNQDIPNWPLTAAPQSALTPDWASDSALKRKALQIDLFCFLCGLCAVAVLGLLLWIVLQISYTAWPAVKVYGISLLTGSRWNPNADLYGILPYLIGTAASSLIAIIVALPLGVFVAIFLSENFFALPVRQSIRFVVEMLAAIPSVVYGLWGITVVIPLMQKWGAPVAAAWGGWLPLFHGPAYGNSLLTAGLVLALMILPTITAISRHALSQLPGELREGAYSLGATRWETIINLLLPSAAPGIVASVILALGRAMGETMAVAMLIGNSSRMSWSLFSPSGTLAGLLANQFAEAQGMVINVLMYAAIVLMLLTLATNVLGDWVLRMAKHQVK